MALSNLSFSQGRSTNLNEFITTKRKIIWIRNKLIIPSHLFIKLIRSVLKKRKPSPSVSPFRMPLINSPRIKALRTQPSLNDPFCVSPLIVPLATAPSDPYPFLISTLKSTVMSQGSLSSTSSGSSSHQPILMLQKEKDDGSPQVRLGRSGTVRRAPSAKPEPLTAEEEVTLEPPPSELRYRKSLDSSYRRSLESISEYKTKHSFSSASLFLSRDASSVDSSSSDCTDCAMRTAEIAKDKTFVSASSSYLSWIESVNSEYFGSANHSGGDVVDVDAKVGEWNNFWLNYNSNNNRYLSSPYLSISNEEKLEDLSDAKSTTSTQREFTDKQFSLDQIVLSHEEVLETIRCAQRITEVLQNAIKRNESDFDESRNDSYYSHIFPALFSVSSFPLGLLLFDLMSFAELSEEGRGAEGEGALLLFGTAGVAEAEADAETSESVEQQLH